MRQVSLVLPNLPEGVILNGGCLLPISMSEQLFAIKVNGVKMFMNKSSAIEGYYFFQILRLRSWHMRWFYFLSTSLLPLRANRKQPLLDY